MKKFINNYKYTMLAQYLALQRATNLRESMKRSVQAVDSPQAKTEKDLSYPFVIGKLLHRFSKIHFTTRL